MTEGLKPTDHRPSTTGVAVLFPGQGSQKAGMGADLDEHFPEARAIFSRAEEILGFSFKEIVFSPDSTELSRTLYAQGAIVTVSYAVYELAIKKLSPAFVCGHSLGEFTAIAASGAIGFQEILSLIKLRAQLMEEASNANPGGMAAVVNLDHANVEAVVNGIEGVVVANYNSPVQVVIAGLKPNLEQAAMQLKDAGARKVVPLNVSGPFHSPWMESASKKLYEQIEKTEVKDPVVPIIGNTSGSVIKNAHALREELKLHMHSSVRWTGTLQTLANEGVELFIEAGPGEVLTGLTRRTLPEAKAIAVCSLESLETLATGKI